MIGDEYLLGIDIGTLGVKCSIVDYYGRIISYSYIPHDVLTPKIDWSEQDPEQHWWNDTVKAIRNVLSSYKINPAQIKAIGVSGLFPDMCPLDRNGRPLRNAILYSDNRSFHEAIYLNNRYNLNITTEEVISKIIWFMKNEPEKFKQTKMILNAPNYITYKLTGVFSTDYLLASYYGGIYDNTKKKWNEILLEELGLTPDILPPVHSTIEVVGEVSQEASKITGLTKGTPVINGTGDVFTTMLSSTVIDPGDTLIYYGTAGLCIILNKYLRDLFVGNFRNIDECLFQVAYVLTTGELLNWFVKELYRYGRYVVEDLGINVYELLDNKASNIPPGCNGLFVLPYFRGERMPRFKPDARGIIFGLTIYHTIYHIYRAMLESFGYVIRLGLQIEEIKRKGIIPKRLVASGGGAKSYLWRQIVTDIIRMPQEYVKDADSSIGAAFLSGLGINALKNIEQIKSWVRIKDVSNPNITNSEKYEELYQGFLRLYNLRS